MFGLSLSLLLIVAGVLLSPAASRADTRPPSPSSPVTVSADALPTVQIDGVAWTQITVGNIVYVGGRFNTARPAGSPAGSNTTPRRNLLAYDITTGALVTSFAPDLNGQVLALAVSPDRTRLYVGGDFTQANGQTRSRVAAYNLTNGTLVSGFAPLASYSVRAIAASTSAVYLAGDFTTVSGVARSRLAAVNPSTGGLLGWAPNADATVNAMTLTADGSKLVVGGRFQNMNATASYGMAALDPATGAKLPWATTNVIRNAGANAAILHLTADAEGVYGVGYVYGSGGNFEGAFRANPSTGDIVWLQDCHGDSYATFPAGDKVYVSSHAHSCANIGGFADSSPRAHHHATAFSKVPACTVTREPSSSYANFAGQPCPELLDWFPSFFTGTFTGQGQATWSVTGNADYISYGGEFPGVNNQSQQGLVRFAVPSKAPNKQGPLTNSTLTPTVTQAPHGTRMTWQATWDRDNEALTYKVYRNFQSTSDTPIYQTTVNSTFWRRPTIGFTDTTGTAGQSANYRVYVSDPFANSVNGGPTSFTPTVTGTSSAYTAAIKADHPKNYWRLGEGSGNTVLDWGGVNDAVGRAGVSRNTPGAIGQDQNTASTFDGTANGFVAAQASEAPSNVVSLEAWIKTTTTRGGKLLGFGNRNTGDSTSYDRHLYLDNTGRVFFGAYQGAARTINSPSPVNDGAWHHLVATLGPDGMRLYVDGSPVASRTDTTAGQAYTGYWRIGGDTLTSWPSAPTSRYLAAAIDEVAVYPSVLSPSRISAHYAASGRGTSNQAPTASFTSSSNGLQAAFDGSGSRDPDGTIASYAWNFGDGTPAGSGPTTTHGYAAAGTYSVTLTVTDNAGATQAVTNPVTVTSGAGPLASDSFQRTVADGLGSADAGGAWTLDGPSSNFAVAGGFGTLTIPSPAGNPAAYLRGVTSSNNDVQVQLAFDKAATGGGFYAALEGRGTKTNGYRGKLRLTSNGQVTADVVRVASGAETSLRSAVVPGLTYAPGQSLTARLQVAGSGTTTLNFKVWRTGEAEPAAWLVTATDSTASLQTLTGVGLWTYVSGSATNTPVKVSFDDLVVKPTN